MRILKIIGITMLSLFVIVWLYSIFVYPGKGHLIQLVNPVFLAALIGIILLARIVRRK
jgi:hypothetical protein